MHFSFFKKIFLSCTLLFAFLGNHTLACAEDLPLFQKNLRLKYTPPVYIRIFKEESTLEIWEKSGQTYKLHKAYKICKWSGKLGPKQVEGDKQSPEGFYDLSSGQMGWYTSKWRQSFNVGFPNNYDLALKRTGTNLLIHGGCTSVGCYAMTNKAIQEIYHFVAGKVEDGQQSIPLHIFPFRMTASNMTYHASSPWSEFWQSLKPAYDAFQETHIPPTIKVCSGNYSVTTRYPRSLTQIMLGRVNRRLKYQRSYLPFNIAHKNTNLSNSCQPVQAQWVANRQARHSYPRRGKGLLRPAINERAYKGKRLYPRLRTATRRVVINCNIKRPSCRRWLFLKKKRLRKIYAKRRHSSKRTRTARRRTKHRRYRKTALRIKRSSKRRRRRR